MDNSVKLKLPWYMFGLIALALIMLFVFLVNALFYNKDQLHAYYQQMIHIEGIALQVSKAHIWLEELATNDTAAHQQQVNVAMDAAFADLAQLQGADALMIQAQTQQYVDDELDRLVQLTQQFRRLIDVRLSDPLQLATDSHTDEQMDNLYDDILARVQRIEVLFNQSFIDHEQQSRQRNTILLILLMLFALGSLVLVLFEDKKRRSAISEALQTRRHLSGAEQDFADLFELSPVSLWLEDFSVVKDKFEQLRNEGITDFGSYCEQHSEFLHDCAQAVRILDVNQATLTLHGVTSKAELLANLSQTFTAQSINTFQQELLDMLDGQMECTHAGQVKKLDGSLIDVIVSAKVMPCHEQKLDKVLVAITDISDLIAAKRKLQISETRFRALVEQSPHSIQILSLQGKSLLVNQAWQRMWPQLDTRTYNIFEDSYYDSCGWAPSIQRAFAGEILELPAVEAPVLMHGDGQQPVRCIQGLIYPVLDAQGGLVEVVLSLEDVTEDVLNEKRIAQSEKRLAMAQQIAKIGNWELDLRSNHLYWSDEVYRIFEIDKKIFGASYEAFLDAIHPEDREQVNAAYLESLKTKQPYEIEHRLLFANGHIKYVHERCENFFDEAGNAIASVGTVQDITELSIARHNEKSQMEKIEHVQRLESLGVLAGGIAHDFNNLLTVIMGNAALANKHIADNTEAKRFVANIESTSERAASLCKQMLAYSGKGQFIVKPLQLGQLVEEMTQLLTVSIAKNIVMRFNLNKQIPAVDADATQMQQIIMNLVINASEAIGERSGSISIATGVVRADKAYLTSTFVDEDLAEGRYVYLEVSDTGVGMDATTKKCLFDPFYTTKFTGRGLGMAAVLGIVRGHHGAIKVYSELGRGTTFKVLLPCSPEKSVAIAHDRTVLDGWHGAGTILVVDDEETIREVISAMLMEMGFAVLTAADGLEGVEMYGIHQANIKAVILDMTMPRMGGEDAFTEMCRINPKVKVMLSSGYNQQDATNRFAGKGLAGFLQKPYMPDALARTLKEILHDEDAAR